MIIDIRDQRFETAEHVLDGALDLSVASLSVSSANTPGTLEHVVSAGAGLFGAICVAGAWAGYGLARLLGKPAALIPSMLLGAAVAVAGTVLAFGAASWFLFSLTRSAEQKRVAIGSAQVRRMLNQSSSRHLLPVRS